MKIRLGSQKIIIAVTFEKNVSSQNKKQRIESFSLANAQDGGIEQLCAFGANCQGGTDQQRTGGKALEYLATRTAAMAAQSHLFFLYRKRYSWAMHIVIIK